MGFPGISTTVSTSNLASAVTVLDGVCAIVATAKVAENIGVAREVYSLQDAEAKGYTELAEPFIHGLLTEFYAELGGTQRLFVYGTAEADTMADIVASANADGLIKLLDYSEGVVNLVAIARDPVAGYDAGAHFLDSDVEATVLASKPLLMAQQAKNMPLRMFIEGRISDEDAPNVFTPEDGTNNFVAVVLGSTMSGGRQAVGLALARACKYKAHVKLGSGTNGALSAQNIYIGTKLWKERLDIETLHDAGFMTFMKRPGSAGFYFGVDKMCSKDDLKILVHGRIIDKAQRVTAETYQPFVETSVELDNDGSIADGEAFYLEQYLTQSLKTALKDQISNVQVQIDNTDTTVITSSTLAVKVRVLPLGYLTWIEIDMGLTNEIVA